MTSRPGGLPRDTKWVEHWSNVAEQVRVLVPAMLGQEPPAAVAVPYFWSDQYDVKIQCLGNLAQPMSFTSSRDDGRKFLAYFERDGVVVGVVGGGMTGPVMKTRGKIAAGVPISEGAGVGLAQPSGNGIERSPRAWGNPTVSSASQYS